VKLLSLYIKKYKNLHEFEISFNSSQTVNILIGKNGSGKSNLFEALIEIFEGLSGESAISFEFRVKYELHGQEIEVGFNGNDLLIDGDVFEKFPREYLPDHIILYYSGHNNRIEDLIRIYEEPFLISRKSPNEDEYRFFLRIDQTHKYILLLLILLLDESVQTRRDIISSLKIEKIMSEIKITLSRPITRKTKMSSWDQNPFWGLGGYLRSFLERMYDNRTQDSILLRREGYIIEDDEYVLYIDKDKLHIELKSGEEINTEQLSDGEMQVAFIDSIMEIFREKDCLFLFDEPDTFLHPEWQSSFIGNIERAIGGLDSGNQIVISSHSASTLVSSNDDQVLLLKSNGRIKPMNVRRDYAIQQLSSGLISLDERKQLLSIINNINVEKKPILFTEGHTDIRIIETAWKKLRSKPMPFSILYGFNCTYLRQLILDEKIKNEAKGIPLFAIFDFDEAYNEWNYLKGEILQEDPYKGLLKKIESREAYAFLLPVPVNEEIRKQVIKNEDTKETYKHESRLTIELLFYGYSETEDSFERESVVGGGNKIVFKGSKPSFASNIVPELPEEAFNVFEPVFAFIESKL
jgi:predicted ATPase